jgi:hypothetical protein
MRHVPTAIGVSATAFAAMLVSFRLLAAGPPQPGTYTASADYTVALPALHSRSGETKISIQNTGNQTTGARIEFYDGTADDCSTSEPIAVRCVDAIAPGTAYTLDLYSDPSLTQAQSAIVRSIGPDSGCSRHAQPGQPLAVAVERAQQRGNTGGLVGRASYVGIAPAVAGFWDAESDAYVTVIPWLEITGTHDTELHLQNIGTTCAAAVELELISGPAGCGPSMPTNHGVSPIAPGQALTIELGALYPSGAEGSAWLRSSQPLAVVVDRWTADGALLSTHVTGQRVAHTMQSAPLVAVGQEGWETAIRVHNASSHFTALAEVGYGADAITPTIISQELICPGGTVSMGPWADVGTPFTGTITLRSAPLGAELPELPPLASEVELLAAGGAAYHAPNVITDTAPGGPAVALPWLTRGYRPVPTLNVTRTSHIAVANQSNVAQGVINLTLYGAEGAVATYQPEAPLGPGRSVTIDLADVPGLSTGWHGSGILQLLSLPPGAPVAATVLEVAEGATGDTLTAYTGPVAQLQAQPTPPPTATATHSPSPPPPTATLQPTSTPGTPAAPAEIYLSLVRR